MNDNTAQIHTTGEIDLVDVSIVLLRHKWHFIITFVVLVLAGIVVAITHTRKYTYTVSIQIGQIILPGQIGSSPIEDPKTAVAKINGGYIPQVLSQYRVAHPDDLTDYKINDSNPDGSNILVLSAEGTMAQQQLLSEFLTGTAQLLVTDENRQVDAIVKGLQAELTAANNKLKGLDDQIALTQSDIRRNGVAIQLAGNEITQLTQRIQETTHSRDAVVKSGSQGDKAFTLLLLNNELTSARARLFNLANTHDVSLPQQRAQLEDTIKSLNRQIADQQATIAQIQAQIQGVVSTHTITPPLRSLHHVGLGRAAIIALAILLGIVLGFIVVFIAAFGEITRARMANDPH